MKVYEYKQCSTCVKALKWLDAHGIAHERVPIVDKPPTKAELKQVLASLEARGETFKKLFNTSGEMYRSLGISKKIADGMTAAEAIDLLSKNGKLVKRPIVPSEGLVGFKEDEWKTAFKA